MRARFQAAGRLGPNAGAPPRASASECCDVGRIVRRAAAEYRSAGDENIRTGGHRHLCGFRRDTSVDLKIDMPPGLRDAFRSCFDFPELTRDETLSAEARIYGHDEH